MGSKASITKAQIVDVAYERAREHGLGSLTVRAVADACGVATGTIYNHVVDIAALRTEVLQRFWSRAVADAKLDECARDAGTALEFCRRLSEALEQTLRGFRDNWLRDLGGLDARTRMRAAEAERACFEDLRGHVRHAFELDPNISEDVRRSVDMGAVGDFVWASLLEGVKRGDGSCETLFSLLGFALYRA